MESLMIGVSCGMGGYLICNEGTNGRMLERGGFWVVRSSATYQSVVPEPVPWQGLSTSGLK